MHPRRCAVLLQAMGWAEQEEGRKTTRGSNLVADADGLGRKAPPRPWRRPGGPQPCTRCSRCLRVLDRFRRAHDDLEAPRPSCAWPCQFLERSVGVTGERAGPCVPRHPGSAHTDHHFGLRRVSQGRAIRDDIVSPGAPGWLRRLGGEAYLASDAQNAHTRKGSSMEDTEPKDQVAPLDHTGGASPAPSSPASGDTQNRPVVDT